jgi:hypothetical protein
MMSVRSTYTSERLLSLPNVAISVFTPAEPRALDRYGKDRGPAQITAKQLRKRDWRKLRDRLIELDLDRSVQVAQWLNDMGYVPRLAYPAQRVGKVPTCAYPESDFQEGRDFVNYHDGPCRPDEPKIPCFWEDEEQWRPEHVNPDISDWLRKRRDVIEWLMSLDQTRFRRSIAHAWSFIEEQRDVKGAQVGAAYWGEKAPNLKDPAVEFARKTKAPKKIDLNTLGTFLIGAGWAPRLSASFQWDRSGHPSVAVLSGNPMEALGLSVHIDKNFSVRRWTHCKNCGKGFEKKRSTDAFCKGSRCRNHYTTKIRRAKLRLLRQGRTAWRKLSPEQRRTRDQWKWITEWAGRKWNSQNPSVESMVIEPAWAERVLSAEPLEEEQEK